MYICMVKKNGWVCRFLERSMSLRSELVSASSDVESWEEISKMLFLFNRCHISLQNTTPSAETDSQEFFFPFLRLQINVACVLSPFHTSTVNIDC